MTKHEESRLLTRQKLIDAFWNIYEKNGIEKTTVKEITEKAGLNRSTFYEYFSDVYEMLEELENSLIPKLENLPPLPTDSLAIDGTFEKVTAIFRENERYYKILLGENGNPRFQIKMKKRLKEIIKKELLKNGIVDDFKIDYTLEFVLSATIGVLVYWFSNKTKPSMEELAELMNSLTPKNYIIIENLNKK